MSVLRCKLRVARVIHELNSDGKTTMEKVTLQAVYSDKEGSENAKWSYWTPSATFDISISNPEAYGKLSTGHEFYVDFTPVEEVK